MSNSNTRGGVVLLQVLRDHERSWRKHGYHELLVVNVFLNSSPEDVAVMEKGCVVGFLAVCLK